ncbi:MAG: hypothetical protein NXI32_03980 [bacterium]|nr:hypothetical protein [bacterium]
MSDSDRLDLSTQKIRSAQANLGRSFADLANEFSGFSNVTAMYALLCCGDEDIDSVYDVVFAYVLNVSDKEKNRVVELLLCALSAVMCFDAEQGGIELLEALVDLVLHNVDEWGRNMRESAVARVEGYGFDDLELEQSLINDFLHRVANLFSDAISVENFAEIAPQNAKRVNCT